MGRSSSVTHAVACGLGEGAVAFIGAGHRERGERQVATVDKVADRCLGAGQREPGAARFLSWYVWPTTGFMGGED
ncbi:hypothetical protein AB0M12_16095 [Nocardia vinacea]|uniref:hypothetical protein n=1 Tax=Nocardia vinacea TaxID=96468 RepID=UPI00343F42C0